jgi:hypothetical protein
MLLKELIKVLDKDQKVIITKGITHLFDDRLYNLELSRLDKRVYNYYVHSMYYSKLYGAIFINTNDYETMWTGYIQ